MTSPKTVTPDQPQAVPYAWAYNDFTTGVEVLSKTPLPDHCNAKALFLAARPVLPVETPAEGLREAIAGLIEDAMIEATVDYPAGHDAGPSVSWDEDRLLDDIMTRIAQPIPARKALASAPAPLSGRDGSLREALEAAVASQPLDDSCESWVHEARAALAAVPPETAEMEGEPVAWEPAGVLVDRLKIDEMVRQWCEGDRNAPEFVSGLVSVLRKRLSRATLCARSADRLAARASSSGEAGDE